MNFTGNTVATGYGAYIAEPLLRRYWKADMTYQEAKDLLDSCMRVLYYRDARALNRVLYLLFVIDHCSLLWEPSQQKAQKYLSHMHWLLIGVLV